LALSSLAEPWPAEYGGVGDDDLDRYGQLCRDAVVVDGDEAGVDAVAFLCDLEGVGQGRPAERLVRHVLAGILRLDLTTNELRS